MTKKEYQEYVEKECERQWNENQKEERGEWAIQSENSKTEYFCDMYEQLKTREDIFYIEKTLVFGMDSAELVDDYDSGVLIHQGSMVVPLLQSTFELEEKVKLFNNAHETAINQNELVRYCIENELLINNSMEQKLIEFYHLKIEDKN